MATLQEMLRQTYGDPFASLPPVMDRVVLEPPAGYVKPTADQEEIQYDNAVYKALDQYHARQNRPNADGTYNEPSLWETYGAGNIHPAATVQNSPGMGRSGGGVALLAGTRSGLNAVAAAGSTFLSFIGVPGAEEARKQFQNLANLYASDAGHTRDAQGNDTGLERTWSGYGARAVSSTARSLTEMGVGRFLGGGTNIGMYTELGLSTYSQGYQEARRKGFGKNAAMGHGLANSVMEVGITEAFRRFGLNGTEGVFGKLFGKPAAQAAAQAFKPMMVNMAKQTAAELAEENIIAVGQSVLSQVDGANPEAFFTNGKFDYGKAFDLISETTAATLTTMGAVQGPALARAGLRRLGGQQNPQPGPAPGPLPGPAPQPGPVPGPAPQAPIPQAAAPAPRPRPAPYIDPSILAGNQAAAPAPRPRPAPYIDPSILAGNQAAAAPRAQDPNSGSTQPAPAPVSAPVSTDPNGTIKQTTIEAAVEKLPEVAAEKLADLDEGATTWEVAHALSVPGRPVRAANLPAAMRDDSTRAQIVRAAKNRVARGEDTSIMAQDPNAGYSQDDDAEHVLSDKPVIPDTDVLSDDNAPSPEDEPTRLRIPEQPAQGREPKLHEGIHLDSQGAQITREITSPDELLSDADVEQIVRENFPEVQLEPVKPSKAEPRKNERVATRTFQNPDGTTTEGRLIVSKVKDGYAVIHAFTDAEGNGQRVTISNPYKTNKAALAKAEALLAKAEGVDEGGRLQGIQDERAGEEAVIEPGEIDAAVAGLNRKTLVDTVAADQGVDPELLQKRLGQEIHRNDDLVVNRETVAKIASKLPRLPGANQDKPAAAPKKKTGAKKAKVDPFAEPKPKKTSKAQREKNLANLDKPGKPRLETTQEIAQDDVRQAQEVFQGISTPAADVEASIKGDGPLSVNAALRVKELREDARKLHPRDKAAAMAYAKAAALQDSLQAMRLAARTAAGETVPTTPAQSQVAAEPAKAPEALPDIPIDVAALAAQERALEGDLAEARSGNSLARVRRIQKKLAQVRKQLAAQHIDPLVAGLPGSHVQGLLPRMLSSPLALVNRALMARLQKVATAFSGSRAATYGIGFVMHGLAGQFNTHANTVHVKPGDFETAAHELGHDLHANSELFNDPAFLDPAIQLEMESLGRRLYGRTVPRGGYVAEGVAEFIRETLTNDAIARHNSPATDAYFQAQLAKHPKAAKILAETQAAAYAWQKKPASERAWLRFSSKFDPDARLRTAWGWFSHNILNPSKWVTSRWEFEKISKQMKAQLGNIQPGDDPALVYRALAGLDAGITENFARELFQIIAPMEGSREKHNALNAYLIALMTDAEQAHTATRLANAQAAAQAAQAAYQAIPHGMVAKKQQAYDRWQKLENKAQHITPRHTGLNPKETHVIIRDMEAAHPELKAIAQKINQYSEKLLDFMSAASPVLADEVATIRAGSPNFYIPLALSLVERQQSHDGGRTGGAGINGLATGKIGKNKAEEGSRGERLYPIEALLNQTMQRVRRAHVQQVVDVTIRAARQTKGIGHQIEQVEGDQKDSPDRNRVFKYMSDTGKVEHYKVSQNMLDSLESLSGTAVQSLQIPLLGEALNATARLQKSGWVATSPRFGLITNVLIDVPGWARKTRGSADPRQLLSHWLGSLGSLVRNALYTGKIPSLGLAKAAGLKPSTDPFLALFFREGLAGNTFYNEHRATAHADMTRFFESKWSGKNIANTLWQWWKSSMEISQQTTMLAEIKQVAKKKGWDINKPLNRDQVLTLVAAAKAIMPYGEAGTSTKKMAQVMPLLTIAPLDVRSEIEAAMLDPEVGLTTYLTRTATQVTLGGLLAWFFFMRDDEDWEKLPDSDKWSHLKIGTGDNALRIPMKTTGQQLFLLPVVAMDALYRQDPATAKAFMWDMVEQFQPNMPPLLQAPMEVIGDTKSPVYKGLSKFGAPLDPGAPIMRRDGEAKESVPQLFRHGPFDPNLQFTLADTMTGGLTTRVARTVDWLLGAGDRPSEQADLPVVGGLFYRDPAVTESLLDLGRLSRSLGNRAEAAKAGNLGLHRRVSAAVNEVGELRVRYHKATDREVRRALIDRMDRVAKRALP